jgi:hypothetical protein
LATTTSPYFFSTQRGVDFTLNNSIAYGRILEKGSFRAIGLMADGIGDMFESILTPMTPEKKAGRRNRQS